MFPYLYLVLSYLILSETLNSFSFPLTPLFCDDTVVCCQVTNPTTIPHQQSMKPLQQQVMLSPSNMSMTLGN
jgi:hypothetical protein